MSCNLCVTYSFIESCKQSLDLNHIFGRTFHATCPGYSLTLPSALAPLTVSLRRTANNLSNWMLLSWRILFTDLSLTRFEHSVLFRLRASALSLALSLKGCLLSGSGRTQGGRCRWAYCWRWPRWTEASRSLAGSCSRGRPRSGRQLAADSWKRRLHLCS